MPRRRGMSDPGDGPVTAAAPAAQPVAAGQPAPVAPAPSPPTNPVDPVNQTAAAPNLHASAIAKPPEFSGSAGSDVNDFLFLLTLYITAMRRTISSELDKVILSGGFLRGGALAWFRANYDQIPDFATFTKLLRSHFAPLNAALIARKQIDELKQINSLQDYVRAFSELGLRISPNYLNSEEALHRFIMGLKPRTRQEVLLRGVTTLVGDDGAFAVAAKFDVSFHTEPTKSAPSGSGGAYQHARTRPTNATINKTASFQRKNPPASSKIVCYRCGGENHKAFECTAPAPVMPSPPPPKN
jgi:hypothetical protein